MKTLVFQSKIGNGSLTWDRKNMRLLKTDQLIIENWSNKRAILV